MRSSATPRGDADGALTDFDEDEDYRRYVDGRTREDGVTGYLSSRGIELALGAPDDPPDAWTTYGLAARKDKLFLTSISRDGVTAYPGTIALLDRLRAGRVAVGLVTASRNADQLLASAELDSRFDVIVDGQVAVPMSTTTGILTPPGSAYTNVLLSWVRARAADTLGVLEGHSRDDLINRMNIRPEEVSQWARLSRRLAVPFHEDGILSQFDGYQDLAELVGHTTGQNTATSVGWTSFWKPRMTRRTGTSWPNRLTY